VEALYSAIRSKALIQYVTPFTSVNLATMATAFATTVGWALPLTELYCPVLLLAWLAN
jgi:hypothetical protein